MKPLQLMICNEKHSQNITHITDNLLHCQGDNRMISYWYIIQVDKSHIGIEGFKLH